jgi:hypothetical protein
MLEIDFGDAFEPEQPPNGEKLHPGHFYAAYIFDRAETREEDVRKVLEVAQDLGYPIRYWWLSDAMDLMGSPDRLVVCVHHPSTSFDAGMDLYDALRGLNASWDDLEAAAPFEYQSYGRPVSDLLQLLLPRGLPLFPAPK